jgi:hypothetical protein
VVVDQEGARGRVRAMGQPPADAAASPSPRAESTRGGDHARACSRAAVDSLDRRSREAKHSGKGAPMSNISVLFEHSLRLTGIGRRHRLRTAVERRSGGRSVAVCERKTPIEAAAAARQRSPRYRRPPPTPGY